MPRPRPCLRFGRWRGDSRSSSTSGEETMPTKGNQMRLRQATALIAALAVGITACGSDDNKADSTNAPAATGGTTAPAATGGSTAPAASGEGKALIVSSDLPLQGASADASADTNLAMQL